MCCMCSAMLSCGSRPTLPRPAVGSVQQDVSAASCGGTLRVYVHHDGACAGLQAAMAQGLVAGPQHL